MESIRPTVVSGRRRPQLKPLKPLSENDMTTRTKTDA